MSRKETFDESSVSSNISSEENSDATKGDNHQQSLKIWNGMDMSDREVFIKGKRTRLNKAQKQLLEYFENDDYVKVSEEDRRNLCHYVRSYIWTKLKFLTGEGILRKVLKGSKIQRVGPKFGNSHERPDFTSNRQGYQWKIIEDRGLKKKCA